MTRNLDHWVEAVTPVEDVSLREQLRFVLETLLTDNRRRWVMQPDGTYRQCVPDDDEGVRDTQQILMNAAKQAAQHSDVANGVFEPFPVTGELLVEATDR
jgi:polyphosphate kinase